MKKEFTAKYGCISAPYQQIVRDKEIISVDKCSNCPFVQLTQHIQLLDDNWYPTQLSCGHPKFKDDEIYTTILISGLDNIKNHIIFEICPLKSKSLIIELKDKEYNRYV